MPTTVSETPDAGLAYRSNSVDIIAILLTDGRRGLNDDEVRSRLSHYGLNELAAKKPVPVWRRFLAQCADVLVTIRVQQR